MKPDTTDMIDVTEEMRNQMGIPKEVTKIPHPNKMMILAVSDRFIPNNAGQIPIYVPLFDSKSFQPKLVKFQILTNVQKT
jgi:hypothetical protein